MTTKTKKIKKWTWEKNKIGENYILDNQKGVVFLSYQPNDWVQRLNLQFPRPMCMHSANPETAIVLLNDKKYGDGWANRYLIFRGDKRKQLEKLYPNVNKLKSYWLKYGGHFFSDNLNDE